MQNDFNIFVHLVLGALSVNFIFVKKKITEAQAQSLFLSKAADKKEK